MILISSNEVILSVRLNKLKNEIPHARTFLCIMSEILDGSSLELIYLLTEFYGKQQLSNNTVYLLAQLWCRGSKGIREHVEREYGSIEKDWDVSEVTTMRGLFAGFQLFNDDISGWDVRNVLDFSGMFYDAAAFNQPIGKWQPQRMRRTNAMFAYAISFDQDLSNWAAWSHSVQRMQFMFYNARQMQAIHFRQWSFGGLNENKDMYQQSVFLSSKIGHPDNLVDPRELSPIIKEQLTQFPDHHMRFVRRLLDRLYHFDDQESADSYRNIALNIIKGESQTINNLSTTNY